MRDASAVTIGAVGLGLFLLYMVVKSIPANPLNIPAGGAL